MGWFAAAPGLSDVAKEKLAHLARSGTSEGSGVAEVLNTIASNDEESASDAFLMVCAEEIRDWADAFVDHLRTHRRVTRAELEETVWAAVGSVFGMEPFQVQASAGVLKVRWADLEQVASVVERRLGVRWAEKDGANGLTAEELVQGCADALGERLVKDEG